MAIYRLEQTELKDDTSFQLTDDKGNYIFGFITVRKANHSDYIFKNYTIVGAVFEGSRFTLKKDFHWKRDKTGSVSRAFQEWYAPIHEEFTLLFPGHYHKQ